MGRPKPGEGYFEYRYGTGVEGEMMDRYGVAGAKSVKPSAQTSVSQSRSVDEVKQDIAGAMTNSYDTRRSMEAAALLGNKDAKKYAKKGFDADNIYGAHETMGGLEKKYGEDYGAGLTHALVNADRDALTTKFKAMSTEDQQATASVTPEETNVEPSQEVQEAKERVAAYQASNRGTSPSPYAERSASFF